MPIKPKKTTAFPPPKAKQKPLLCWLGLAGGGLASGVVLAQPVELLGSLPLLKMSDVLQPRQPVQFMRLATTLAMPPRHPRHPRQAEEPREPERPEYPLLPALALGQAPRGAASQVQAAVLVLTDPGLAINRLDEDEDDVPLPQPSSGRAPEPGLPATPTVLAQSGSRRVEEDLPDLSGEQWELAPIRWSGQIASNMNRAWDDRDNSTTSVGQTNSVNASSYIYAPWFAQTTAGATYSTVRSWHRMDADADKTKDSKAEGKAYSLSGGLNLFPMSNFPFQTYYNYNRNKAQGEEASSRSISSLFGMSQNFRSADGTESLGYHYNRNSNKVGGPNNLNNSLGLNYSARLNEDQNLTASAQYTDDESGAADVMRKSLMLVANHNWRIDDGLNLGSNATVTQTENDVFQTGNDRAKSRSQVAQFSSNVTWQPYDEDDEALPMIVNGGGTVLNIEQDQPDESKNRLTLLSGTGSLSYRFTDRLIGILAGGLTRMDNNGKQVTSYNGSTGLNYAGMPTLLGPLVHTWTTGTNANFNRTTGNVGSETLSANIGQALSLPLPGMTLSVNQGISGASTSSFGEVNTLSHSVSLSKQLGNADEVASGQVSTNLAHNKTAGVLGGHSNSFNLMANGKWQISRRQELMMNANVTWMKQVQQKQDISPSLLVVNNSVVDIDEARWVGSASFAYSHMAPFDVRNLSYRANLMFSSTETTQQQTLAGFFGGGGGGPVNPLFAPGNERHWIHTMVFNQSLTYLVGRVNLQLSNVISRVDGVDNVMIFGHVARRFGTF